MFLTHASSHTDTLIAILSIPTGGVRVMILTVAYLDKSTSAEKLDTSVCKQVNVKVKSFSSIKFTNYRITEALTQERENN